MFSERTRQSSEIPKASLIVCSCLHNFCFGKLRTSPLGRSLFGELHNPTEKKKFKFNVSQHFRPKINLHLTALCAERKKKFHLG